MRGRVCARLCITELKKHVFPRFAIPRALGTRGPEGPWDLQKGKGIKGWTIPSRTWVWFFWILDVPLSYHVSR